ncbi:hypothetical protein [Hymenobacter jeollabukensis]|uniref:Uncharacterized protein n=1 Tax=Hymenobacter jeollabukensis TaxID=2025313 RepID=A0A5R8WPW2_9BACT|nr:hypothetical protein [Hymenobacter jeollabukensis]TLM91900.1 hypothetical protein FDY95_15220 [Hymenobacter jeollabukensis]
MSVTDPRHRLAESPRYLIYHTHETAHLYIKGSRRADVVIGGFCGDPQTACIAPDESYCVVAGSGLVLYFLQAPFADYAYGQTSANWREWGRTPTDIYWIEAVYSPEPATAIRFVVDPLDEVRQGVYELNTADFTVEKLL